MPYNFDQIIDRQQSGSAKWHLYDPDVIPAWVADMDFASPEPILTALHERIRHGIFGYEWPGTALTEIVTAWLERRYGWKVEPEAIHFLPGLVSGLNLICRAYGHMGDHALMLTPVYPPFLSAPPQQGLVTDTVPLRPIFAGPCLRYEIDFNALARAITPRTRLFIHCHPHNPTGHEYTHAELTQLAELCRKHDILICSDEIHGDLMLDGRTHTPMAALAPEIAEHCVTLMAPSKTFNIPGLGCSFAVVTNPRLRERLRHAEAGIVPHVNVLGLTATAAAFTACDDWLLALQGYLTANRNELLTFVDAHLPGIRVTSPEATYLAWFDCSQMDLPSRPHQFFLDQARVALQDGAAFGPGGEGFLRFNFGCPRSTMMQALERMAAALQRQKQASPPPTDLSGRERCE